MADELKDLIRQEGKIIRIYLGVESQIDPFSKEVSVTLHNPIPIKAIVTTVASEKLIWKFYGIKVQEAKELIVNNKDLKLIRMSHKIEIGETEFYAYRDNIASFTIQELDENYSRVTIWRVE